MIYSGPMVVGAAMVGTGENTEFDLVKVAKPAEHYGVTANGTVIGGASVLCSLMCVSGASASLTLYDNTTAVGTPVYPAKTFSVGEKVEFDHEIIFRTCMLAVVGGSSSPQFQVMAWE